MRTADGWIGVDWGTTNRRAYAFDGAGQRAGEFADSSGILSVGKDGFTQAVADIRARLGDLPMVLAGMVGSNRGWIEAPYLACPLNLEALAAAAIPAPDGRGWIVPGASFAEPGHFDVMRGEEVQLLGAIAEGIAPPNGLVCHPGTHAKWARLEHGAIVSFRTVMTGEMFALLRKHSILAPQLTAEVRADAAFLEGVGRSLARSELTGELFGVRARSLLSNFAPGEATAFTSGLLIGADVRIGLSGARDDDPLTVIGDPRLTTLYAAAIGSAGRTCIEIDGEAAFLGGIKAIAEKLL